MSLPAGHGSKIGRKQEAAIAALLSAATIEAAAERAGIGRATATTVEGGGTRPGASRAAPDRWSPWRRVVP
jgi:hypothetical protein